MSFLPVVRRLPVAGAIAILVLFFTGFRVMAQADVDPAAPDAPGSIAGTVIDANGVPLEGIAVDLDVGGMPWWQIDRTVNTDAAGSYRFGALMAGIYRVGFRDPSNLYARQYYSGTSILADAVELAVAGNNLTGVDAHLVMAGAITGTVHSTTPGYFYAPLRAYAANVEGAWFPATPLVDVSNSQMGYSLTALAPGVYRVCAILPYWHGSGESCYAGTVAGVSHAENVTVTAGAATQGIDIVFGAETDWPQLGGRVTDAGGIPLADIEVTAYQPGGYDWYAVAMTTTNAAGRYLLDALAPGDYVVGFAERRGPHLSAYYPGVYQPQEATPIALNAGMARLDVDAALALGATISGAVSLADADVPPYAFVTVLTLAGDQPTDIKTVNMDRTTGSYIVGGLQAGTYFVRGWAYDRTISLVGYYSRTSTIATATPLTVAAGDKMEGIDLTLALGAYEGALEGTVRSNGAPVAGITVNLYLPGYAGYASYSPLVYTHTGSDGRYGFEGLLEADYHVGFQDPAGAFASVFYSGTANFDGSEAIRVLNGRPTGPIDQALVQGGGVEGQVRSSSGAPLPGVAAIFYSYTPAPPWFPPPTAVPFQASTNAEGRYTMRGLLPGAYRVCFAPQQAPFYLGRCYGAPEAYQPSEGTDVIVRAGEMTTSIDQVLGPQKLLPGYLPFVSR